MKLPFLFLLFQAFSLFLTAQEYSYKKYTTDHGLPQSEIIALYQDSRGYIWIGTKAGLSRFDGLENTNFYISDGLAANYIVDIKENSKKELIVLTRYGVNIIKNSEVIEPAEKLNTRIPYDRQAAIDRKDHVWMINKNQDLIKFDGNTYHNINQKGIIPDSLTLNSLTYCSKRNKLLLSTRNNGIFALRESRLKHLVDQPNQNPLILISHSENDVFCHNRKKFYTLKNNQLNEYCTSPRRLASDPKMVTWNHKNNNLIFSTREFELYEFNGNSLKTYKTNFSRINCLLVDDEENLWVGMETGLNKMLSRAFLNFTHKNSGINNYIYSIAEDDKGNMYFASFGEGLTRYNGNNFERLNAYRNLINDDHFYMGATYSKRKGVTLPNAGGILHYKNGGFRLNHNIPGKATLEIYVDSVNQSILYGNIQGLYVEKPDDTVENYHVSPGGDQDGYITAITRDKENRYWLGGIYGLSWLRDGDITHLPCEKYDYNHGAICLLRDYRDNLWLGTREGLFHFNYKSFKKIAPEKIPSYVVSLTETPSGEMVIGALNKIFTLDLNDFYSKNREKVTVYDKSNGYLGVECIQNGLFTDSKGNVWIPATDRVVKFMPDLEEKLTYPPRIYIKSIHTLNQAMEWEQQAHYHGDADTSIQLSHQSKHIRFHFAGIHHSAPKKVRYQYRLEGFNEGWSKPTGERFATYTNLSPGEYTFKVKACNMKGIWNKEPAILQVTILPALWQRTWFVILLSVIGLGFLILFIFYLSSKKQQIKQSRMENEKRLAELKLLSIRNQMEPHFTFNALNSIAATMLTGENTQAYDHLTRFSKLMRASLEDSEKINRTLREEIEFVKNYLEIQKFRHDDKFDYEFHLADEIDLEQPVPKMILQIHVENAIKHGIKHKTGRGKIWIYVQKRNHSMEITVEDNGIGREKASSIGSHSSGKGIKIIEEINKLFNKFNKEKIKHYIEDLFDKQGQPSGTRARVIIPENYRFEI